MKSTVQPTTPRRACDFCKWHRALSCETNGLYCEDFSGNTAALADEMDRRIRLHKQKSRSTTGRGGKGGLGKSHVRKLHSKLAEAAEVLALKRHHEWDRLVGQVAKALANTEAIRGLLENFNVGTGLSSETPGCGRCENQSKCNGNEPCVVICPSPPRAKGGKTKTSECNHYYGMTRCPHCGLSWYTSASVVQKCPSKPGQT